MIKSLSYHVSFPTTGRSFKNKIDFEPGLTAILGANESGKSLVLEFIRYAWFGKAALRGKATDYKNLTVQLTAEVKGQTVEIIREPKQERLLLDGKLKAVGAEAINAWVPGFLGFGLAVHDIALTALQDNLHALTEMRPTARRAMIDQLTGTNALEAVEKECRAEAREKMKVAEALITSVYEPTAPEPPEFLDQYEELVAKRNEAHAIIGQRRVLEAVPHADEPQEPEKLDLDVEELTRHERERQSQLQSIARLEGEISSLPATTVSDSDFQRMGLALEYQQECQRRGPKPEHELPSLLQWEQDHYHLATETVTCPECKTEFVPTTGQKVGKVETPPLTLAQVREEIHRHERWKEPLEEIIYDGPEFDYATEKRAQEGAGRRTELQRSLEEQRPLRDRSTELASILRNQQEWSAYEASKDRWQRYQEAQTQLASLEKAEDLTEIEQHISDIEVYRRNKQSYDEALAQFVKVSQQAKEIQEEAEGFEAGQKALKATRLVVKQELVPSLSKSASYFLSSFTDGERNRVIIDQDFNIEVDKQSVDTLSGSGKAVVNLALRIALAQVLTSQVLSLFMGDEIDGSMDSQRAESTHNTFRNITRHLEQVILVTHKEIDADHIIRLEE